MTRRKTISDEELLAVARSVFREHGHTATTREVARQAGISEGILYQRFGSKEHLFFAAMIPRQPDFEALLGPHPPEEPARTFFGHVLVRMATYFADVIPLALQVITHPSGLSAGIEHAQPGLRETYVALVSRLEWFESQGQLRASTAARAAQLLMSLAHDWALVHAAHGGGGPGTDDLEEMAEIVWRGVAP